MRAWRSFSMVDLLVILVLGMCPGCQDAGGASASVDCPVMLKRVKDGVLEIGRRHQSGSRETLMLVESLHDRIAGYDVILEECDPESAETVVKILESLQSILESRQSGAALEQSLAALIALAESIPVEATPAAEYDD